MELKSDRRSNVPTPQIESTVNEIATVRAISVQQFVGTTWHDTRAPRRDERQLGPEDGVGNSSPATVAHEQLHAPRADRRRAHRLDRGADAVRQLRRFGAGTCPCLNLGAYFHLGIFNEQFDFDGLHRVDRWTKNNIRAAQKNNIRAVRASVSRRNATQSRGRRDASTN